MKRFGQGPDLIDAFRENHSYSSRLGSLQNTSVALESQEPQSCQATNGKLNFHSPLCQQLLSAWFAYHQCWRRGSPLVPCKEIRRCMFPEGDSGWMDVAELWQRSGFQQHRLDNPW